MHCTSCAMLIEGELEDIGVQACCNYARQTVDVEFDEGKVTDTAIQQAVVKAGYRIEE